MSDLTPSFRDANQELVHSFMRYLESQGKRTTTIRKYKDTCQRFIDQLGSAAMVGASRSDIRVFQSGLIERQLGDNSVRLHTGALRSFYKFINRSGISPHNPMLLVSQRKVPRRLPAVLSRLEVQALIDAARNPFELAVIEVLYATGVRRAELVSLRVGGICWPVGDDPGSIRVKNGKGGKDRIVLFGKHAAEAMRAYLKWRPSRSGFLFESPVRIASVRPGFRGTSARPYNPAAIAVMLNRVAHRAGIGHVHPHSLRRAMACHMLQSGGDIRAIQDLLGHARLSTTMLYTTLTAEDLKRVHEKCHPHENGRKGGSNGE